MDIKLIRALLDFNNKMGFDYECLNNKELDFIYLLGYLNINRVSAIAYKTIIDRDITVLKNNTEFMRNLNINYKYNLVLNKFMSYDVKFVSQILNSTDEQYVFLKGSYLSNMIYPKGLRISNDIDILILPDSLFHIEKILLENGFLQGYIQYDGSFQKASRTDIIRSRMNYGEVVPFTKIFEDHSVRVDINLSLDYKPAVDDSIALMLKNRQFFSVDEMTKSPTLSIYDFFIHLCCHLFKEATTYNWVEDNRDLSIYKFSDIYVYLHKFLNPDLVMDLQHFIKKYSVQKECYYTLVNSIKLYPSLKKLKGLDELILSICPQTLNFMDQVVRPDKKLVYIYNIPFEKRLFESNRIKYLKPIE